MTEIIKFVPKVGWPGTSEKKQIVPIQFDENGDVHRVTCQQDSNEWIWLAQVAIDAHVLPGKTRWKVAKRKRDASLRLAFY